MDCLSSGVICGGALWVADWAGKGASCDWQGEMLCTCDCVCAVLVDATALGHLTGDDGGLGDERGDELESL